MVSAHYGATKTQQISMEECLSSYSSLRMSVINTRLPTHFHVQSSAIDLTLCSPQLIADLEWSTLDCTFGSDRYPIY